MLSMYLTHAYDVLGEISKDLRYATRSDEITDSIDMIKHFEKNSVTLYDRLYISRRLVTAHSEAGNYFLFRCRRKGVVKGIQDFYKTLSFRKKINIEGVEVMLIKIYNPKKKEVDVFATNLADVWLTKNIIENLYAKRWEVENSYRDFVQNLRANQWHSKHLNGILQELYASFWLLNFTRLQIIIRQKKVKNPFEKEYKKPNFKLILDFIIGVFPKILRKIRNVLAPIKELINYSTEKRRHRSRSYPRHIKRPASPYPYNNVVWDWDVMQK